MEKDSLEKELRNIYFRYDTLETNNLEIQAEMQIQQEKIDKLIAEMEGKTLAEVIEAGNGMLAKFGGGGGGGGSGGGAAAGGDDAEEEEEKVEEEEEADIGGGMDMFGGDEGGDY